MKRILPLLLIVCSFALSSCKKFEDITVTKIEDVKVISFNQQGVEAIITAIIKNPNKVGFTIYKSEMDATIEGMDVGKTSLAEKVKIKAKSETAHDFHIKSNFSKLSVTDLPKIIAIAMSKEVNVGLKGKLKVGKFYVKYAVPVDIKKTVPLR